MADPGLLQRARKAGLAVRWQDATGANRTVSQNTLKRLLPVLETGTEDSKPARMPSMIVTEVGLATSLVPGPNAALPARFKLQLEGGETLSGALRMAGGVSMLPPVSQPGYHQLEIGHETVTLAVAPKCCPGIADRVTESRQSQRPWGLAAQVYGLRMEGDGGIGHFGAVTALVRDAAAQGAAALALSPVHALFSKHPEQHSPYSPSTRLFLNVLLADPHALFTQDMLVEAARQCSIEAAELTALEQASLINWPRAGALRLQLLRALYETHIAPVPPAPLLAFIAAGGRDLRLHAVFEALQTGFHEPLGCDWRQWPENLRDPDGPAVKRFEKTGAQEIGFHFFLQWLADVSLRAATQASQEAGMAIGLIMDLAIGVDPGGSQCWSAQQEFLVGAQIGAPPDALGPQGQNWGLTGFAPGAMPGNGYHGFVATLKAGFRFGGGMRLDHVMGLERLWIIPEGGSAADGAYLRYPGKALMRLVALEAMRHDAIVIGEDLGTVIPAFRERAARKQIMGMNVMWFEREHDGGFRASAHWSSHAVAMTTTHDLPGITGWWLGRDIDWREKLGQSHNSARDDRARDRSLLWKVISGSGPMPPVTEAGAKAVTDAAIGFAARAACPLAILPLEDLLGLKEQPNLPGTVDEHPNWQRRYPLSPCAGKKSRNRLAMMREIRG